MEPPQRSPGSRARLLAKVAARHVRERRACAGTIISDSGTVNQSRRRLFGRLRRAVVVVVLLMLDGSGAFADSAPTADTVILLQPTTASLAFRRSLARIRDELSADRFHVVVADSSVP